MKIYSVILMFVMSCMFIACTSSEDIEATDATSATDVVETADSDEETDIADELDTAEIRE
jgi:ABC-type enterochelin transport system substrate-binding protein